MEAIALKSCAAWRWGAAGESEARAPPPQRSCFYSPEPTRATTVLPIFLRGFPRRRFLPAALLTGNPIFPGVSPYSKKKRSAPRQHFTTLGKQRQQPVDEVGRGGWPRRHDSCGGSYATATQFLRRTKLSRERGRKTGLPVKKLGWDFPRGFSRCAVMVFLNIPAY